MKTQLNILFFTLLSLLIAFNSNGQNIEESVEKIKNFDNALHSYPDSTHSRATALLQENPDDMAIHVKSHYILGSIYDNQHQKLKAKTHWKKGLKAAIAIKDSAFMAHLSYKLASVYYFTGKMDSANIFFSQTYEIANASKDIYNKAFGLYGLGIIDRFNGDYTEGEKHFRAGIKLAQKSANSMLEWQLYNGLIGNLAEAERFSESIVEAEKGLAVAKRLNDSLLIARSELFFGILMGQNQDFEQSIKYLMNSMAYFKKVNSYHSLGVAYMNLSFAYQNRDDFQLDSATHYSKKALDIGIKLNIIPLQVKALNTISSAYVLQEKFDTAKEYALKVIELFDGSAMPTFTTITYINLSKVSIVEGKYETAINYCKKGIQLLSKENIVDKYDFFEMLADCYNEIGNYKEAFKYSQLKFEAIIKKRDIEETKRVTRLQAKHKYEKEKEALEKIQLKKDSENQQKLSRVQNLLLIGAIFILLICTIVFLLYRLYRNKRKDNQLLEVSNKEIKDQASKLQELDQLKSRFFTNISHEFRTPLTLIKGPVDQLRQKKYLKAEDSNLLATIYKNSDRLLSLINQILELSELQSKKRDLQLSPVNIQSFFNRIVSSFESLAETRKIQLTCTIPNTEADIYFEKESIEKTLINLLSNAFKFTKDSGTIDVNVSIENDWLKLIVEDTGIGIEEKELEKIFEMFYYTESDQSASSGIGLALINELIKNHQGNIQVESEKNKGTIFTINIPITPDYYQLHKVTYEIKDQVHHSNLTSSIPQAEDTAETSRRNEDETAEKETILLIEDNAEIRSFMKEILSDSFITIEAENGLIGVEKAIAHTPDLIISDVMMPELDGFEAAKRLKSDERTSHIPIILLTAKGDKESKLEGLSIQIDDYLVKPFDNDELLLRINNLIKNRKLLQEKFGKGLLSNPDKIDIPSIDQQFINKVRKVIEERIDDTDLSVDELAKIVGVSRSQMHRKIVALSGKSTSVFIRNIRLKRAYALLEKQTATVSEISDQVGFSSPSYFNKCFKELYGITPKQVFSKQ